jgi:peroxiredoxin
VCNREAPSVEEAAVRLADQANFVGVAWTGSDTDFQGFIDRHGLTFPQVSDDPGDVFARFGIVYQPALAVVTADGGVETVAGSVDGTLLDQIVAEAG